MWPPCGALDEKRLAADAAKGAHGGIDAAGDEGLGAGEEGVGEQCGPRDRG